MKQVQNHSWMSFAALVLLMALTRFNHFGSALALPDASWAVFFLGGFYFGRGRVALAGFALLALESVLIDYYAIAIQGVSDWCVTNAYGFMLFAYAALWWAGVHAANTVKRIKWFAWAALATLGAFLISNASFYWFSGRYEQMPLFDYASRVAPYFVSYLAVTLMYIACAVVLEMLLGKPRSSAGIHSA